MRAMRPSHLDGVRLRVVERIAALLESQTRTKVFSLNIRALVKGVHNEIVAALQHGVVEVDSRLRSEVLEVAAASCARLEESLDLLVRERVRQGTRSGSYIQDTIYEFNEILTNLSAVLVEKDLFERQSKVLERIILSHEHVTQWKEFVQAILADFHSIFPFNFFYIAFAEEHGLALYLYYLGDYSDAVKKTAREMLTAKMIAALSLPLDAPLDIEEFQIKTSKAINSLDDIKMITVAVPDHTPKLAGLLGVAYVASGLLNAQEESVVRSILAVMVMVVDSSKALSRTLAELEFYSLHDPLTSLYNRRQFNNMLSYEAGRSERHQHEFSLLMLDLDDFKEINDSYGHQVGDDALCGVAEVLRSHIRKGDVAARLGGDEFGVILMETGRPGAITVANQLGKSLRERVFQAPNGKTYHLTFSIGVATFPQDARLEADLVAGADLAMYRAKALGKMAPARWISCRKSWKTTAIRVTIPSACAPH